VTTKEDLAAHNALFITTLKGHGDEITGIAWSPDAKLFATACADMHVRLYDIHDLKGKDPKFRFLRTQYPPLGVGFGNEGNRMVVAVRGGALPACNSPAVYDRPLLGACGILAVPCKLPDSFCFVV
jgi:hypothetical protein